MIISNCRKNKISVNVLFILLVFLSGCSDKYAYSALQRGPHHLNYNPKDWRVLSDSGWPGNSSGSIKNLDNRIVRFDYILKATKLWPWPEIDFLLKFKKKENLTKYTGVELYVKSSKTQEVYLYFLVEDKNLRILKPSLQRILITSKYQRIILPFSQFKIASDWIPRQPGFNPSIEWENVRAVGFHKKGRDGEQGSIYLSLINFLQKIPQKIFDLEQIRSQPPKYTLINLKSSHVKKADINITIYESMFLQKNKTVSPYLYGANFGVWLSLPDENKVMPLNLKVLRIGGPFIDRYNWHNNKYTFPGSKKPLLMTSLDNFIQYCRNIGAEPLIQINALGYAPNDKNKFIKCINPDEAANLVRYLNKERRYNVKFFEIGNEPFIWHEVHWDINKKPYSIDEYFKIFKEISVAMKKSQAEIDSASDIKIFAPAISTPYLNWRTLDLQDSQYSAVEYFLKKCYEYQNNKYENPEGIRILDVLSFHLFPLFRDPKSREIPEDITNILESTQTWWNPHYINKYDYSLPLGISAEVLPKFTKWIEENYPGTELAITEFNIESQSMVDYDPIIKVLYLTDLYGIMAYYGVDYAVQFCLNSSDQNAALIDDTDNITPLYYPLALYTRYFQGTILHTETSLPERLNVYACDNKGDIIIMVINKQKKPYYAEVVLKEEKEDKGKISFSHNFPALSLTCIKISANQKNNLAECWEYGERQINRVIGNNSDS